MSAVPFEIQRHEQGVTGSNGASHMTVLDHGQMFKRRAVRASMATQEKTNIEWLVGELNGVRVYSDGHHVIVTTQDLYP